MCQQLVSPHHKTVTKNSNDHVEREDYSTNQKIQDKSKDVKKVFASQDSKSKDSEKKHVNMKTESKEESKRRENIKPESEAKDCKSGEVKASQEKGREVEATNNPQVEKEGGEEEEEEDADGMRAMRKETNNTLASLEAEFEAGRSKLAAVRARIKRAREMARTTDED